MLKLRDPITLISDLPVKLGEWSAKIARRNTLVKWSAAIARRYKLGKDLNSMRWLCLELNLSE